MLRLPLIVALSIACLLAPVMGRAASSKRVTTKRDSVSLVSAKTAVSGKTVKLGLLFHMAKGWHIHWKNPGVAGQAPDLAVTVPEGARASALSFPAPHWFVTGTVGDYVETGKVLLPFTVTLPRKPGAQDHNPRKHELGVVLRETEPDMSDDGRAFDGATQSLVVSEDASCMEDQMFSCGRHLQPPTSLLKQVRVDRPFEA